MEKVSKKSNNPITDKEATGLSSTPEPAIGETSPLEGEPHEETTVDLEPDTPVVNAEPSLGENTRSESELELLVAASKRDEYYDLLQRVKADFENYRKRIERERVELATRAAKDLIEDLLPLIDDLKLAIRAASLDPANSAHREGIELIYRRLLELLGKRGLTAIVAEGHDFDPNLHDAMTHEKSERHRNGEVIEDLRTGYMLGNQLLRATWVKVAKSE